MPVPLGTFTYEATDSKKTVKDKQLSVTFTIKNTDLPTTDFSETLNNVSYLNPNVVNTTSVIYKDIVLNDLVVYAYKYDVSGLVAGTGKVKIISLFGTSVVEGKLVAYPNIAEELGSFGSTDFSEVYALKFVPDKPIQAGDLSNFPGLYRVVFETAAFGDANYGKWLANPGSVAAADCKVNPEMSGPTYQIDNDKGYDPTAIRTVTFGDADSQVIYDLNGSRIERVTKKGVYILNGKKVIIK